MGVDYLVGGLTNPFEKICSSNGIISPSRNEKKQYLKPPPRYIFCCNFLPRILSLKTCWSNGFWDSGTLKNQQIFTHLGGA